MSRLEGIKARLDAATPGDWSYKSTSNPKMDRSDDCRPVWRVERFYPDGRIVNGPGFVLSDAEFIVRAPEDIAYLLSEVEKLRGVLREVRELAMLSTTSAAYTLRSDILNILDDEEQA